MSSGFSLPRNKISPDNIKLYRSLGSLIKEYRQWRDLSQETFAESIQISVRQLQNWESDRRRARIENLHYISEFTGIPMQVLVALNADQPVLYSLQKRLVASSSIEKEHFSSNDFFKNRGRSDTTGLISFLPMSEYKHIDRILSCHDDIYGNKIPLHRDFIEAAIGIFPDLNIVSFDYWGHYVGHQVCLPLKMNAYQNLKEQKDFQNYLTPQSINDIADPQKVVIFYYSVFFASVSIAYFTCLFGARCLARQKDIEKYLIASLPATKESRQILSNLGMKLVRTLGDERSEICPSIFETKWDRIKRTRGPLGWMFKRSDKEVLPEEPAEKSSAGKTSGHSPPLIVDRMPPIVDKGKSQSVNSRIEVCTNPKCALYRKPGKGNIVSNGTYRTKGGTPGRRFYCKQCGKSFCRRTGTIFYDLRSPEEKVLKALKLLVKGMTLQRVAKSVGVKFDTVRHWVEVAAHKREEINAILIKEPDVSRKELDTLWDFVETGSLLQRAILQRVQNKASKMD